MKALLIEDELPARGKLESMLFAIDPTVKVVAKLGSVKEAVSWLQSNTEPDLAFVDIQLSDDHSFEIFRQYPVQFPVIFTTAYDKYLLESFEFNSIDYLLKPVTEAKLRKSLDKLKMLKQHFLQTNLNRLLDHIQAPSRSRVLAKKGTEYIALNMDDVAYFFTEHKIVFARDFSGRQLIVDKTLTDLEGIVNQSTFFRLNRKYLCNIKAIEKFKPESGRIKVFVAPESGEEIFVSKETAPNFRSWIS